jgi:oligopeptide transport system permease protein
LPAAGEVAGVVGVPRIRRRLLRKPRIVIPLGVVVLILIVAAVPGLFTRTDPRACDLANSGTGPVAGHPFGFDIQGCDLYSNVVYGTRSSVTIGFTVTAGCVLIALVLGCLAAYYRGMVDAVISRTMDIFFGFPALVGQVVILNTLHQRNVVIVSAVLILFAWPAMTRLMRSAALATVDLDFVKAARGLGAGPVRVIARHVLPNSFAPILAVASLGVGGMITAESALTFLGVGLRAPSISWGVQLNQAQDSFRDHPHLLLFPSLFLSVTVLSFVMLGDALRDAFDPRSR